MTYHFNDVNAIKMTAKTQGQRIFRGTLAFIPTGHDLIIQTPKGCKKLNFSSKNKNSESLWLPYKRFDSDFF